MEICNHVHQIRIDFNVTEDVKRYVYVYLLTGSSCFLIDAGVAVSYTHLTLPTTERV